ncbi:H-NS family histone-like protein [Enterovibrio norvegicus]|uniref:H-NS family histone-like protein n=1 Tax=Enterovibrio norvegicus TaxID=188144 RepID=UPI000C86491D|nr:hypothetical protein [Enterovibrio norvegicus]PMH64569.1 hypothetical protein BCU62_16060 [Enterovibrio norvegicus]
MSSATENTATNTLLTAIGTKPQFKKQLRALTRDEFDKVEKTLLDGLADVRTEITEKELAESEKQAAIQTSIKKVLEETGLSISDFKSHLNKSS